MARAYDMGSHEVQFDVLGVRNAAENGVGLFGVDAVLLHENSLGHPDAMPTIDGFPQVGLAAKVGQRHRDVGADQAGQVPVVARSGSGDRLLPRARPRPEAHRPRV